VARVDLKADRKTACQVRLCRAWRSTGHRRRTRRGAPADGGMAGTARCGGLPAGRSRRGTRPSCGPGIGCGPL
jgi:hypothetical protein